MMTKTMLDQEWSMIVDQAIEAEAQAQAICMQTQDFRRAYDAFVAKQKPDVRRELMMPDTSFLLAVLRDRHRALAEKLERVGGRTISRISIITMSTPPAASWSTHWARTAGSS